MVQEDSFLFCFSSRHAYTDGLLFCHKVKFNYGSHPVCTNVDFFHLFPMPKLHGGNICCLPNVYPSFTLLPETLPFWRFSHAKCKEELGSEYNTPSSSSHFPQCHVPFLCSFHCSWPQPWGHPWLTTFFHPLNPKLIRNVISFFKIHAAAPPALWLVPSVIMTITMSTWSSALPS